MNYATEARDSLLGWNSLVGTEGDWRQTNATEALVLATLAVAEQQRIANLIALAQYADERYANYAGEAGPMASLFEPPNMPNGNMVLKHDIREALGIEQS